jgi:uncharacterized protein YceK
MQSMKRWLVVVVFTALFTAGVGAPSSMYMAHAQQSHQQPQGGFNDEYIFAATRGLNEWQGVHPALKVTLFPATVLVDTVFLPFSVIAGFMT